MAFLQNDLLDDYEFHRVNHYQPLFQKKLDNIIKELNEKEFQSEWTRKAEEERIRTGREIIEEVKEGLND